MYSSEELKNITGGGFSWGVFTAITAGITFIISVIDGYFRPLKCNK
ncbi:MAG: hypothetical protein IJB82_03245 [Bacilli bacterium]|nr:hypothetical protein [Bacilli bacterium]